MMTSTAEDATPSSPEGGRKALNRKIVSQLSIDQRDLSVSVHATVIVVVVEKY